MFEACRTTSLKSRCRRSEPTPETNFHKFGVDNFSVWSEARSASKIDNSFFCILCFSLFTQTWFGEHAEGRTFLKKNVSSRKNEELWLVSQPRVHSQSILKAFHPSNRFGPNIPFLMATSQLQCSKLLVQTHTELSLSTIVQQLAPAHRSSRTTTELPLRCRDSFDAKSLVCLGRSKRQFICSSRSVSVSTSPFKTWCPCVCCRSGFCNFWPCI